MTNKHYIISFHTHQNGLKHVALRLANLKISWKHVLQFALFPAPTFLGLFFTLHWFRVHYVIRVRVWSYTQKTILFPKYSQK